MTKTIASIYFEPLSARRDIYGGVFNLPAVEKGKPPALLVVTDHRQVETLPFLAGKDVNGRPRQNRITITGGEIAADLMQHWTQHHPDMGSDCGPGVWAVRDVIYLTDDDGKPILDAEGRGTFRDATADEKKAMFDEDLKTAVERQAKWGERAIVKGDLMAEDPKKVPFIPDYCKKAARYYGRDRTWLHELKDNDVKSCQFCTKVIAFHAVKCPHCSEIVDPVRYALLKTTEKQAMERAEKGVVHPPVAKTAA